MRVQHEQRKYPRMSVSGGDYRRPLQGQGQGIQDNRLVNLSAGGCCLEVDMAEWGRSTWGTVVEDLYLDHPDLPAVPLSALVMRILGKVAGKTHGYVLMGVEFQGITEFARNLIAEHVSAQLTEG